MRSSRSLPLLADQGSLKGSVRLDGLHCELLPPHRKEDAKVLKDLPVKPLKNKSVLDSADLF